MALDLTNIKSVIGLKSGTTFKKIQTSAGKVVWKAGAIVTYMVDTASSYTEEVDNGASCLAPTTFTPAKDGWVFVGWREDTSADSSVLTSKVMDSEPITLYAVFKQDITVIWHNSATSVSETKQRYYNNSNVVNPSFSRTLTALSGWTAIGWSTNNTTNETYDYGSGGTFTRDSSVNLYAKYKQTITVTYYNNSSTASTTTGTRYYTPHDSYYRNPSFTLTQASKSGWTARGWSTSNAGNATVTYDNATAFTRDSNVTLYGMYQQTITLKTVANGSTSSKDGTRYWAPAGYVNPTFTVSNPTKSGATFKGWSTGNDTTTEYSSISNTAFSASATLYAVFKYSDYSNSVDRTGGDEQYYSLGTVTLSNYASGTWRVLGIYDNPLGNSSNTLNYECSANYNCNAYKADTDDVTVNIPSSWFSLGSKTLYAYFESSWCRGIVTLTGKTVVG